MKIGGAYNMEVGMRYANVKELVAGFWRPWSFSNHPKYEPSLSLNVSFSSFAKHYGVLLNKVWVAKSPWAWKEQERSSKQKCLCTDSGGGLCLRLPSVKAQFLSYSDFWSQTLTFSRLTCELLFIKSRTAHRTLFCYRLVWSSCLLSLGWKVT